MYYFYINSIDIIVDFNYICKNSIKYVSMKKFCIFLLTIMLSCAFTSCEKELCDEVVLLDYDLIGLPKPTNYNDVIEVNSDSISFDIVALNYVTGVRCDDKIIIHIPPKKSEYSTPFCDLRIAKNGSKYTSRVSLKPNTTSQSRMFIIFIGVYPFLNDIIIKQAPEDSSLAVNRYN